MSVHDAEQQLCLEAEITDVMTRHQSAVLL